MRGPRRRFARWSAGLVFGLMAGFVTGLAAAEPPGAESERVEPEAAPVEQRIEGGQPARDRGRDASPRERRARREALRGLVRALPDARPGERLAILREAARLPFAERRVLRERLRRLDELAPAERAALVTELEGLRERAGEDVERFERNLDRWEKLSEADRERYRAQMQRLREMSVEERRRLLEEWERSDKGRAPAAEAAPPLALPSGASED